MNVFNNYQVENLHILLATSATIGAYTVASGGNYSNTAQDMLLRRTTFTGNTLQQVCWSFKLSENWNLRPITAQLFWIGLEDANIIAYQWRAVATRNGDNYLVAPTVVTLNPMARSGFITALPGVEIGIGNNPQPGDLCNLALERTVDMFATTYPILAVVKVPLII